MECGGKVYISYRGSERIKIWNVADVHYGNRGCNKQRFEEDIETILNDPYSFWYGGGDYADYISYTDKKRFAAGTIDPEITVEQLGCLGKTQAQWCVDRFQKIRHKCIGLLLGNHECKYMTAKEQTDLHSWMCKELEVLNLGYCCLSDVVFVKSGKVKTPKLYHYGNPYKNKNEAGDRFTTRFFLHHGFSGSTTPGGKLNSLIKAMNQFDADVYMMGHVHDQKGQRNVRIAADADCKKLVAQETIGVITGSYLMTYTQGTSSYGEQKGYSATPLGAVKVTVDTTTRKITGEV